MLGLKNSSCEYTSSGFLVTGDPVMIRLNLANLLIFIAFLVLEAVGVLIVVDSSIAKRDLFLFKKCVAYFIPTLPLRASIFINTIRSLPFGCTISFNFFLSSFVISLGAFQAAMV